MGVLVPVGVAEAILRSDLTRPPVAFVLGMVPVLALLWRRTSPLAVVIVAFGAQTIADLVPPLGASEPFLYVTACVLLLPYALLRWGSGRDAVAGLAFILTVHILREILNSNYIDVLVGIPFLMLPAALGASVRYRADVRAREADRIKLREREQLARELHDTVAHHVSAIAIQAQAGRALAASEPTAALSALEVIEEEASRTLSEMRDMVRTLRQGEVPDLVPQRGIADIARLADGPGDAPAVEVTLSGGLGGLRPSIEAAIYRLAQESITNARRHARHATRISVDVAADAESVRLEVHDDGDADPHAARASWGFGLVGMSERAALLGGTLAAGPDPAGGWTVTAALPRHGTAG